MKHLLVAILAAAVAACGGGGGDRPRPKPRPPVVQPADLCGVPYTAEEDAAGVEHFCDPRDVGVCTAWLIGPKNKDGHNYSKGMPLYPALEPDGSCSLTLGPTAEPHYVMLSVRLAGMQAIRLQYWTQGDPDAVIYGAKEVCRNSPSAVTIHLTSDPTNFTGETHRWWATWASQTLAAPFEGKREILVTKDGPWTSAFTATKATHPRQFEAAWEAARQAGFTFANCEGYGHGARATKPVKLFWTFDVLRTPPIPAAVGERG